MKIKLRKTDKLFTRLVRYIFDYTCQRCGKKYVFNGVKIRSLSNLGVSHYYSRSRENTRFDIENVTLLCNFPCHRLWETEDREEYKQYMIKRLGQEGFIYLTLRANTYCKRDDVLVELWLKQELEGIAKLCGTNSNQKMTQKNE